MALSIFLRFGRIKPTDSCQMWKVGTFLIDRYFVSSRLSMSPHRFFRLSKAHLQRLPLDLITSLGLFPLAPSFFLKFLRQAFI